MVAPLAKAYYHVGIIEGLSMKKSGLSEDMIDGITFVVIIACIVTGLVYWLSTYQVAY